MRIFSNSSFRGLELFGGVAARRPLRFRPASRGIPTGTFTCLPGLLNTEQEEKVLNESKSGLASLTYLLYKLWQFTGKCFFLL